MDVLTKLGVATFLTVHQKEIVRWKEIELVKLISETETDSKK